MDKLIISLSFIVSGLTLGYTIQVLVRRSIISLPLPIDQLRKTLQKVGILFFMPISFMAAVWIVKFGDMRIVFLPFVGICALLLGGVLGLTLARLLQSPPQQKGVLICCGSFTNIGAIGGLVCYMFLGEAGFALIVLYKMFEEVIYYTIGFPIARYYSGASNQPQSIMRKIGAIVTDPFVATALSAFLIGLLLNFTGVPRPEIFATITAISIPAGTFVLIVSIGLSMRFSHVGSCLKEAMGLCVIKFFIVPGVTCSVAYLLGLHQLADGLPFKVVLILSSMPVAFNALVATSIYDLDLDLANSCWLVSTGGLLIIMPWLYFLCTSTWLPQ